MARNQKRKVGEDFKFSPADKRRMSVDDTGLVGLALLMDGMERFGEQPTFSVVAGKKKQKTISCIIYLAVFFLHKSKLQYKIFEKTYGVECQRFYQTGVSAHCYF